MDSHTKELWNYLQTALQRKYMKVECLMLYHGNTEKLSSLKHDINNMFKKLIDLIEIIPDEACKEILNDVIKLRREKEEFDLRIQKWYEKLRNDAMSKTKKARSVISSATDSVRSENTSRASFNKRRIRSRIRHDLAVLQLRQTEKKLEDEMIQSEEAKMMAHIRRLKCEKEVREAQRKVELRKVKALAWEMESNMGSIKGDGDIKFSGDTEMPNLRWQRLQSCAEEIVKPGNDMTSQMLKDCTQVRKVLHSTAHDIVAQTGMSSLNRPRPASPQDPYVELIRENCYPECNSDSCHDKVRFAMMPNVCTDFPTPQKIVENGMFSAHVSNTTGANRDGDNLGKNGLPMNEYAARPDVSPEVVPFRRFVRDCPYADMLRQGKIPDWREEMKLSPTNNNMSSVDTAQNHEYRSLQEVCELEGRRRYNTHYQESGPQRYSPATVSRKTRSAAYNIGADTEEEATELKKDSECPCCYEPHQLSNCMDFKSKSHDDKISFLKEYKLCYKCLCDGHNARNCNKPNQCNVQGCKGNRHHMLLHGRLESEEKLKKPVQEPAVSLRTKSQQYGKAEDMQSVYLGVVPVNVRNGNRLTCSYAMLDSASNVTLCSDCLMKDLGVTATSRDITLCTIGQRLIQYKEIAGNKVSPLDGGIEQELTDVLLVDKIPARPNKALDCHHLNHMLHLQNVNLATLEDGLVDILKGDDNAYLMCFRDICSGPMNAPKGVKSLLGWSLFGSNFISSSGVRENHLSSEHNVNFEKCNDCGIQLEIDTLRTTEFGKEILVHDIPTSREDQVVEENKQNSAEHIDGHFQLSLPWRPGMQDLSDKEMAKKRLRYLIQSQLIRDSDLRERYVEVVGNYMEAGYAKRISDNETYASNNVWHLQYFSVVNQHEPRKVCVVFDAAARHNNLSLNDCLMSGSEIGVDIVEWVLQLMKNGEFSLTKWLKNNDQLLTHIPEEHPRAECMPDHLINCSAKDRVLGIQWNVTNDVIGFKVNVVDTSITRREWDQEIPDEDAVRLQNWLHQLTNLEKAKIQQCYRLLEFGKAARCVILLVESRISSGDHLKTEVVPEGEEPRKRMSWWLMILNLDQDGPWEESWMLIVTKGTCLYCAC